MKRFLASEKLVPGARVQLGPNEARHAARVLRLSVGAEVLLTDGRGNEALARLTEVGKEEVWAEVTELKAPRSTRSCRVELLQAPLKGPRMDWLVEKLTELGLDALHPVRTEFTVAGNEKEDRWSRLVQAAVKQSGSPHLLQIHPVVEFGDLTISVEESGDQKILLSPGATEGLAQVIQSAKATKPRRILLAIGPEGGFSDREEETLKRLGFVPAALSNQILRGESAAISAVAITLHLIDF